MERAGGGKTSADGSRGRVARRVWRGRITPRARLLDQWKVTPNPKSTTFCFQPVANVPPPDTLRSPTPPYTKLATGVRETLRPTRISYPTPAVNPQPVPSTEGLVSNL